MKVTRSTRKTAGNKRGRISVILAVLLVIILLFFLLASFLTDLLWYKELGYLSVFLKRYVTQLEIGVPMFVVLSVLLNLYLNKLRKNYFEKIASKEETDAKKLKKYTWIAAFAFALVASVITAQSLWYSMLQFMNASHVGIDDPLFGNDISFYLFRLEFLEDLNGLLIALIVLLIAVTVVYYLILLVVHSPEVFEKDYSGQNGLQVSRENLTGLVSIASGWLSFLGMVLFAMLAFGFFLQQYNLLQDHTGAVYGAGYVDVHVRLWMYRILCVLSIAGALSVAFFVKKKQIRKIAIIPVCMVAIYLLGTGAGFAVQNLIVSPDELNKESTYLSHNIEFTRYAYGIDDITTESFAAANSLTASDIADNSQTVQNIRINDYNPVADYLNQTQSIRQYYTFHDVDVDRYMIDGQLTQTYLSLREIDEENISNTWLNQHLKYTHGFGLTLSKVNTVTASGQPNVLIKNIPPESSVEEIEIDEPRIYFGERTNSYALVNTKEEEFDYPDGSENQYTTYEGTAGISMDFLNRVLFSIREQSLKLLVSTNITSDSKILIYRNIEDRVRKIMPYLTYDGDPYAVVSDGKVYWIMDAYTTSSMYPYSEPYSESSRTNYIRNSVKVVIDAYNGDVSFYIVEEDEPIAQTLAGIFPKLFKNMDQMPEGLKTHLRYPDQLLAVQSRIYCRYHMENVKVFYQDEDRWEIANQIYGTEEAAMEPNYFIVKLPGEDEAEFISMIPFTPKNKQNMSGLLIARNDGEYYGELLVYEFPKSKTVYGPAQVEAMIDQSTEISQDFSLWSQAGSTYSRGTLFVVPVNDSLLYVEPIYLEASNSAIPEVKRVVVVYGEKIAYASTLGDALDELFGETGGTDTSDDISGDETDGEKSQADYIKDAQNAYERAQDALKDGDWSKYGSYMEDLEEALGKLSA